ncbi:uncharacterized protein DS421_12g356990 [Arachis hypogaea]|nr:uncharacterized protein DS421_12g356990 [Arachis hypogaea]
MFAYLYIVYHNPEQVGRNHNPCVYPGSLYTNQPGASRARPQPLRLPRRYVLICPRGTNEGILTSYHLAGGDFYNTRRNKEGDPHLPPSPGVALSRKKNIGHAHASAAGTCGRASLAHDAYALAHSRTHAWEAVATTCE